MNKYKKSIRQIFPDSVKFSVFTENEIKNLSVTEILIPSSFDTLGHPLKGGLYDPLLGPLIESSDPCGTCGENILRCPGHFGHIELPIPVVNPLFHKTLGMLLKLSCLKCHLIQIPKHIKLLLIAKFTLLQQGFISDIEDLDQEVACVVAGKNSLQEGEVEYIKDIIETYIQCLHNRKKFNQYSNKTTATKNTNMLWHKLLSNVLKQYNAGKICVFCQEYIPKISLIKNKIFTTKTSNLSTEPISSQVKKKLESIVIMPAKSKEYLRNIYNKEEDFMNIIIPCLKFVNIEHPTDIFFFEIVPVIPPSARPINFLKDQIVEHPQSQVYKGIIHDCLILRNIIQAKQDGNTDHLSQESILGLEKIKGSNDIEKLHNVWLSLQANVDHLMDRDLNKTTESVSSIGLKQIIEKKEGIIRMHMMGKRVNYAARSVVTPDPNLNIDEIGIPEAFALKLTYPTPVTTWNIIKLRQLVINGPNVHPGATMVENEDGSIIRLNPDNYTQRLAIAKRLLPTCDRANCYFKGTKTVYRHLNNGDVLLVNRQPTLHKPSIMAHKARILKGEKTLRLHYANCKAFNADFDGDELNIHAVQDEIAKSEGYFIANVSNQYLVPKDGTPLSGLIQDHVISGVRLTMRGQFFDKNSYMELVYSAVSTNPNKIITLPPCILKPKCLWSGKQIISTVILNIVPGNRSKINMTSNSKISIKNWQTEEQRPWKCGIEFTNPYTMSESEVIFQNGELVCGVLDKMHYGATPYSLIHCIYEFYGSQYAIKMLSAFGKLFQLFLQMNSFTLGILDILIIPKAEKKRKKINSKCRGISEDIQTSLFGDLTDVDASKITAIVEESYFTDPMFRAKVDRKYKSVLDVFTNDINKVCLPAGLLVKFPDNNLQLMVESGAKGSTVNTMQISCLLGQVELEGRRPPLMVSGKSLPSFKPYDPSPRAGGFIDGRFLTGIKSQELYFHCMAGREGLIDTAVKTSRSGYLQRCLIKHLEGLTIHYDMTVRDSDDTVIQFIYGEDGLDVCGSKFLKEEMLPLLIDNKDIILDKELLEKFKTNSNYNNILKMAKKIKKYEENKGSVLEKRRESAFAKFSAENMNPTSLKHKKININSGRSKGALSLMRKWLKADDETKNIFNAKCKKCPDPISSIYTPGLEFGALSEKLESLINNYYNKDNTHSNKIKRSDLRDLLSLKVMQSVCHHGEPVGLLAAQSVGEPSTQLTLNTFHFAGRGEMNVTLGIPRLREILMMASKKIKTPSMEIPFKKNLKNVKKQSNKLKQKLTKCFLSDVLENLFVDGKMVYTPQKQYVYTLNIKYLPHKEYKHIYYINPEDPIIGTEEKFIRELFKEIKKKGKLSKNLLHSEEEKKSQNNDALLDEDDPNNDIELKRTPRLDIGENHESSDEEEPAEDADASVLRRVSRHEENKEYDDPEDEEMEIIENEDESTNKPKNKLLDEEVIDDDEIANNIDGVISRKRKRDIIQMYPNLIDYDYDEENFEWSKITFWLPVKLITLDLRLIIKEVAHKVILYEIPQIKKAFIFQNNDGETILKTDGINVVEMFKYYKVLDLNRLYSNDIYGVSQIYGIEAAYRVLIKEISEVFRMYGITVDRRHLSLISDYMMHSGEYQPLSRKGMEDSASPLQQMSFETALNVIKEATLQAKTDDLSSPSSRLMVGMPCKSGTGGFSMFNVLYDLTAYK